MLSYEDCVEASDLTEEEIEAVACLLYTSDAADE